MTLILSKAEIVNHQPKTEINHLDPEGISEENQNKDNSELLPKQCQNGFEQASQD